VPWARLAFALFGALALGICAALAVRFWNPADGSRPQRRPAGTLTFNKDIAPILYHNCAGCHHPGGPAPFHLIDYADVKKRASQIADVTERRLMPPWLPEPGCGEFVGERSLSAEQIALIQQWAEEGANEGPASDAPPPPTWREGWELGKPDLIITLAEPFTLEADGQDVYRNFVIPIPVLDRRFVRAVELDPANPRAVHHAFMFIDPTRESRRLDEKDPNPGFPGLHVPASAQAPPGHFLSWQPGKRHTTNSADLAWTLEKNSDLVIQMHLRPTGKPEKIQPSVGFYFADHPAPRRPVKFGLWSYDIDIPAGEPNYLLRDSYILPADVELMRILPHAHFLGRRMEATATLPDGRTICLLRIHNWDFNWQGDYTYRQPVSLPRGTVISMVFAYDNSANNPRNPNQPPRRVQYGVQSSDEMGELWLQVMPRTPEAALALEKDMQPKILSASLSYNRYVLGLDPKNAKAHNEMGKALLFQGGKTNEALRFLQRAAQLQPEYDEPHYYLGLLYRTQRKLDEARREFQIALQFNPGNNKTHGNLGLVLMELGDIDGAEKSFVAALRLNPDDEIARTSLQQLRDYRGPEKKP
jgi:Tfp pilus assembly protein PilF